MGWYFDLYPSVLIVEGIERTDKQVFFSWTSYFGLILAQSTHLYGKRKAITFQHKSKQELGQHIYTIEVRGLQGIHKTQWNFVVSFSNRDTVRKMISIIKQEI